VADALLFLELDYARLWAQSSGGEELQALASKVQKCIIAPKKYCTRKVIQSFAI